MTLEIGEMILAIELEGVVRSLLILDGKAEETTAERRDPRLSIVLETMR